MLGAMTVCFSFAQKGRTVDAPHRACECLWNRKSFHEHGARARVARVCPNMSALCERQEAAGSEEDTRTSCFLCAKFTSCIPAPSSLHADNLPRIFVCLCVCGCVSFQIKTETFQITGKTHVFRCRGIPFKSNFGPLDLTLIAIYHSHAQTQACSHL